MVTMKTGPFVFLNVYPSHEHRENGGPRAHHTEGTYCKDPQRGHISVSTQHLFGLCLMHPATQQWDHLSMGRIFGYHFVPLTSVTFLPTQPNCLKIFPFCCQCLKPLNVSEVIPFLLNTLHSCLPQHLLL